MQKINQRCGDNNITTSSKMAYMSGIRVAQPPNSVSGDKLHVSVCLGGPRQQVRVVESHTAGLQQRPVQQLQLGASQRGDLRGKVVADDQALR